ncbi:ABC transporter permease [Rothia dentocariosa]|uniref:ABC transporter permease n=1 Tax=Rothia dentocariosa TaxID=2047 RepID=UPI00066122D5|nr:ABC transporter permease [Rothia dentocariosa]
MATTLNTVGRANLRASKGKYILTGIGIAISSFFIAAVIVLVSSLQGTLNASVNGILSKADNVVVSSYARDNSNTEANIYLDEESIKNIQNDDSVDQSWIVYQGRGKFGPDKTQVSYTQAPNSADLFPFDFEGKLPTSDTELMVSKDFAQKHNLQLNSKVSSPDIVASISDPNTGTTREYTITGIFDVGFSGSDTNNAMFIGGTSYGEAANKALKNAGGASSANYAVPGASMAYVKFKGTDDSAARAELQKKLNTGDKKTEPSVMSGPEYMEVVKKQLSTMFTFLGIILGAFAALALLVSSFVISNTFAVLVGQRIRELALLRTLGAQGSSLVRMLVVESLVVGVIFSTIGAVLVYPIAALLSALSNNSFMVSYDPMAFVVGVVLCTLVTVIASLAPARTALKISPISAMGETTAQAVKKPNIAGLIAGLIIGAGGGALMILAFNTITQNNDSSNAGTSVLLVMIAALLLGIAVFMLTPWLLLPLVRVLGSVFRNQTGKLAVANALRSPKRTVSTGRAVLVGALVVTAVLTGYSIMTSTVANAMDKLYPISAAATYGTGPTAGSESVNKARSVADKVRGLENVDSVAVASAAGTVDFTVPPKDGGEAQNRTENLVALSHDDLTKVIPTEGSHQLEDDTVLVSAALYDNAHFNDSTRLKARGPLGTVELKPIKSTSSNMSLYIVNPTTGTKLQNASDPKPLLDSSQAPENAQVPAEATPDAGEQSSAASSTSGATGAQTMVLVHAKSPLSSSANSTLQEQLTKANDGNEFTGGLQGRQQFDQIMMIMLIFTLVLLALAVVISIIGVANTMTLSVNERRRENAMLRSLGLSRKQLRRMISAEAILITLGAVILGILAGVGIGIAAAKVVIAGTSSSTEVVIDLPYLGLFFVLLVGLVSAFVASILPAARSARLSPVEGMRG